ncbi:hypothetical protein BC835DRAFT_1311119 [Cytidiella melzeri]|nr:hypothetical protein BC835DRAFT_1311119 [Cytidiella melzeri]
MWGNPKICTNWLRMLRQQNESRSAPQHHHRVGVVVCCSLAMRLSETQGSSSMKYRIYVLVGWYQRKLIKCSPATNIINTAIPAILTTGSTPRGSHQVVRRLRAANHTTRVNMRGRISFPDVRTGRQSLSLLPETEILPDWDEVGCKSVIEQNVIRMCGRVGPYWYTSAPSSLIVVEFLAV